MSQKSGLYPDIQDLKDCDLIEEAIPGDLQSKKKTFVALDAVCKPKTIFGSNTSRLSITDMAVATKRADKVIGMDFHVLVMQLLEVVKTIMTGQETIEAVREMGGHHRKDQPCRGP